MYVIIIVTIIINYIFFISKLVSAVKTAKLIINTIKYLFIKKSNLIKTISDKYFNTTNFHKMSPKINAMHLFNNNIVLFFIINIQVCRAESNKTLFAI